MDLKRGFPCVGLAHGAKAGFEYLGTNERVGAILLYTLYGGGFSRAHLTEMVLIETGVPYRLIEVDTEKGEHRTPEFLEINPAGWVPALITPEGQTLYEAPAINLFLAERHGAGWLAPVGDDPDRGAFLSGLFYLADELEPALKRYFYPQRYGLRPGDGPAIRQKSLDTVCGVLAVIEQRLAANGPYHLGARYSLVDLVLSYWINSIMDRKAVAGFTAINLCVAGVTARPGLTPLFDDLQGRTEAYRKISAP